MEPVNVPDLSKWTENLLNKQDIIDDKENTVGLAKFFFKYDLRNSDARIRKLMQQCVVFYAFGIECSTKSWTVHAVGDSGEITQVTYSAILTDRINDRWAVGLPDELWDPEIIYSGDKITGLNIRLKTAEGIKLVYIKNPDYKK